MGMGIRTKIKKGAKEDDSWEWRFLEIFQCTQRTGHRGVLVVIGFLFLGGCGIES